MVKTNQLSHQMEMLNQMYQESQSSLQAETEKGREAEGKLGDIAARGEALKGEKEHLESYLR